MPQKYPLYLFQHVRFKKCPFGIFENPKNLCSHFFKLFFGNETIMITSDFLNFFFELQNLFSETDKKNVRFGQKFFQFEIFVLFCFYGGI